MLIPGHSKPASIFCVHGYKQQPRSRRDLKVNLGNVGNQQLQLRWLRLIEGKWVHHDSQWHFITKWPQNTLNNIKWFYLTAWERDFLWQDESRFHAVGRPDSGYNFTVRHPNSIGDSRSFRLRCFHPAVHFDWRVAGPAGLIMPNGHPLWIKLDWISRCTCHGWLITPNRTVH